jgi:hypothetical protein
MTQQDLALAEKLTLRRARVATVLGIFFIVGMATSFNVDPMASRAAGFRIGGWVVWAAALLLLVTVGGGLLRGAQVRALMNDDSTRDHRSRAMVTGYWAAMLCAFVLYFIMLFEPVTGREAVRLILTVGVGAAAIRFGRLEMQSLKNA